MARREVRACKRVCPERSACHSRLSSDTTEREFKLPPTTGPGTALANLRPERVHDSYARTHYVRGVVTFENTRTTEDAEKRLRRFRKNVFVPGLIRESHFYETGRRNEAPPVFLNQILSIQIGSMYGKLWSEISMTPIPSSW